MKVSLEFQNGACKAKLITEDDWEQLLLGAIAKGGGTLSCKVDYESSGHVSYGKCKAVSLFLEACE